MKFNITVQVSYEQIIEVEADSLEEAFETAKDQFDPDEADVLSLDLFSE